MNVTQAAEQLGVSRVALSRVLNGHTAVSTELALRVEAWLGVKRGGSARLWLAEQSAYDVWQAQRRFKAVPLRVQPALHTLPDLLAGMRPGDMPKALGGDEAKPVGREVIGD